MKINLIFLLSVILGVVFIKGLLPPGVNEYQIAFIYLLIGLFLFFFSSQLFKLNKNTILLLLAINLFIVLYFLLINIFAINHPYYEPILFPFWSSNDLNFMIESSGNRYNAIEKFGRDGVEKVINRDDRFSQGLTRFILTLLLIIPLLIDYFLLLKFEPYKFYFENKKQKNSALNTENIKLLISQDKTELAIKALSKYVSKLADNDLENQLSILSYNLSVAKREKRLGVLDDNTPFNKINLGLLELIDEIQNTQSNE